MKVFVILLFVVLGPAAFADSESEKAAREKQRSAEAAVVETLCVEKVPLYEVNKASLQEALDVLQRSWKKRYPRTPFPIGLGDFEQYFSGGDRLKADARITLRLEDITYWDVVLILAVQSSSRLSQKNGVVKIATAEGNWTTQAYNLSPAELAGLKLNAKSSPKEVRAALRSFDIELASWMKVELADSGGSPVIPTLVVTTLPEQQEKISGLLRLLEQGFTIQK